MFERKKERSECGGFDADATPSMPAFSLGTRPVATRPKVLVHGVAAAE
jgi:hypothetical protein